MGIFFLAAGKLTFFGGGGITSKLARNLLQKHDRKTENREQPQPSKDGCRCAASAAYCALSAGSKPIEEVPKVIPAWQDGALHPKYGTLVPQHGFSPLVSPVALTAPRRRRRGGMREWDGRLVSPRHRRKWPRPPHFLLAATLFAVLLLCLPLSWHHANASAALAPAPSLLAPPSEGLRLARDLIVVACHAVYTAEDHGHAALQRETSWFLEPFRAGCTLH